MATTKKRINISVSKPVEKMLTALAKRDGVPQATKAAELLRQVIEIEEDAVWAEFASKRDTKSATFVSHKEAWK
ncbi:MAG: hypothetical protein WD003_01030 [Candidatus Paceibacterota bacterium]